MVATGEIVCLAEWIFNETCLVTYSIWTLEISTVQKLGRVKLIHAKST